MIYKHILGDVDQEAPPKNAVAVARIDDQVFINTGEFSEEQDGSFNFKADGQQVTVSLDDLLWALGFEQEKE